MPRILVLLLPFLAGGAVLAPAEAVRKCGTPASEPLMAVDGTIAGTLAAAQRAAADSGGAFLGDPRNPRIVLPNGRVLEGSDVLRLDIACMNPRDSTFTTGTGIAVVSIWTKSGPAAQLEPTLAAILRAQHAHLERHGSYATMLTDLELPPVHPAIQLALNTQPDGWSVTATIRRYPEQCLAFAGEIEPPIDGFPAGQPHCTAVARTSYAP